MRTVAEYKEILNNFYLNEGPEHCGFIIADGTICEVKNVSGDVMNGFEMSPQDIITHTEKLGATATWHTHPNQDANLSGYDHTTFMSWKKLFHFIIGNDGVRCFKYSGETNGIIEASDTELV